MPARRGLLFPFAVATALWACSSSIELKPLDESTDSESAPASTDEGGSGEPSGATPAAAAAQTTGETLPSPMLVNPGAAGSGAAGTSPTSSAPGAAPIPDRAGGDTGGETAGGGDMASCTGDRDADGDGKPDACDPCGIGVALGLSPLFYFPLDETVATTGAANLGSVRQAGACVGPIERGWAGVADPQGRAPRFLGEADGAFSRVEVLNVAAFPSTALTAMFWVRTSQSGDYVVISYAIQGSANEFAVIIERDRLIVTLQSSTFQALDIDRNRITDGTWHFVALTWDSTRAQFYFDGDAVGAPLITEAGYEIAESVSVPVTGPLALSPGGALVLGQDQDSLDGDFSFEQALIGGLDEVAIYDRVLSPDQIRGIFTATTCGERCDGVDNDGDGKIDEGFLGSSPACPAASCGAIAATSGFGPGDYFSSVTPAVPLTCYF
ncbi:MAG TPA: LamG-like jellyroll fold domain-containing protein [Polyangiaceae bacterium]|nr:LamG-like jellyroll fold domain-containing protein [Polyangiaceae bacterium]